jgi:hypothetical protein
MYVVHDGRNGRRAVAVAGYFNIMGPYIAYRG